MKKIERDEWILLGLCVTSMVLGLAAILWPKYDHVFLVTAAATLCTGTVMLIRESNRKSS